MVLCLDIIAINEAGVSCTQAEKNSLEEHDKQFLAALYHLDSAIEAHQEQLEVLTGSTIAAEDITTGGDTTIDTTMDMSTMEME